MTLELKAEVFDKEKHSMISEVVGDGGGIIFFFPGYVFVCDCLFLIRILGP